MSEVEQWLEAGITAVKNKDRVAARSLLMQVLEADEENEAAWLWLSSVMEDEAARRTCLENVLALNPDNVAARRTLLALDQPAAEAAAVPAIEPAIIQFQQHETFEDVWSRNVPLCGYCAAQVEPEQNRCLRCHHNLLTTTYQYPNASSNLALYWFSLVIVAVTFLVQMGYRSVLQPSPLTVITGILMVLLLVGTAVALNFRQFWANWLAIALLILIVILGVATLFITPDLSALGFNHLDPAIRGVLEPLTSNTWKVIKGSQILMAALALFFAFLAAPDFERIRYRQIATVTKGLRFASEYHTAAQRLAKVGLWATAVLNWQRATALEPTRITYQRSLGEAYARLGFYERSLDVLRAARRMATHPDIQIELEAIIQKIEQQSSPTTAPQTTHG